MSERGRPVSADDAKVSVFDRGFLYGDSVYETMRTAGAHAVELPRHLARLHQSAAGIGLTFPFTDAYIADAIAQTHRATGNDESYVRVIVSRGAGPIMLDPRESASPQLVILVQPLSLPTPERIAKGIAAVLVDVVKSGGSGLDPRIKSG
ncbi:MAG: aminotransferase class IV, partial [Myxococcota bacterium]